jgi:hypothetical protein
MDDVIINKLSLLDNYKARVSRIKIPDNKVHLVLPAWSCLYNGFTLLFEAFMLQLSTGMSVPQACKLVKISDHENGPL